MNSFAEKSPEILKPILERNSVDSILNSNKNIRPGQVRIRNRMGGQAFLIVVIGV